jgi:hypothetical protein
MRQSVAIREKYVLCEKYHVRRYTETLTVIPRTYNEFGKRSAIHYSLAFFRFPIRGLPFTIDQS